MKQRGIFLRNKYLLPNKGNFTIVEPIKKKIMRPAIVNKFLLSSLLILLLFLSPFARAQYGWKWGKGCTGRMTTLEIFSSSMDKYGNVIAAGLATGDTTFIGGQAIPNPELTSQLIITKWDSSGNMLWWIATRYANNVACEPAVAVDSAGSVYVVSRHDISSFSIGAYSFTDTLTTASYITKISESGTVLWAKNIATFSSMGPQKIGVDKDNNVYVQTPFNGKTAMVGSAILHNADTAGTYGDLLLARYDTAGNVIWAKNFGSAGHDLCTGFAVAQNGDIYLSGEFFGPAMAIGSFTLTGYPQFFIRVNRDGNVIWAKNLHDHLLVYGITTTPTDQIYVAGSLDAATRIGADSLKHCGTEPHTYDAFVVSCDTSGNIIWARSAGGLQNDRALNITTDGCGNIWINGSMGSGAWINYLMDFYGDTLTLPYPYSIDGMFIASYSATGAYLQGITTASGGDDYCGLLFDRKGYFYIVGDYVQTDITFGPDTLLFAPPGEEPFFIAKYKYDTVLCTAAEAVNTYADNEHDITLFPSPTNNECVIQSNIPFHGGAKVDFYDMAGRKAGSYLLSGTSTTVSVTSFPPGIYLCRIVMANGVVTIKKLVVMK